MPVDPSLDLTPAFENFDGWLAVQPEERKQAVERTFAFTPPALLDSRRKQWLSAGLISQRTGREPGEVLNNFAAYSGAFARDPRGLNLPIPPKDANEFYDAAKMKLGQEKTDKAAALAGSQAGMQAALEDKGLLSGMADYAGDAMAHPEQEATNTAFFNAYTATHQIIAPHTALLKAVPDAVERTMDGKGTPEDQQTIIDAHEQLADMPDNERQHVMTALQLEANKRGAVNAATKGGSGYMGALVQMMQMGIPGGSQGSRSFMQQTGESAARFASAGIFEGPSREMSEHALARVGTTGTVWAKGPIENAADANRYVADAEAYHVDMAHPTSEYDTGPDAMTHKITLTPEQTKLIENAKDRRQRLLQVRGEMTAMGHTIDPVPNLFASTFGSSGVAVGVTALTRGAALPVLVSIYKGSEYNDLSTKYPQMSAADKSEISSISGAVQGLGDMVEFSALKRLPGLNSLIQGGWKAALIKKALLRGAGVNLTENAVELVQDYATPVLMAALKSDVPGYSWDDEVKDFAKGRLDVAIGMLPLTLVGLGAASIGEYRGTKNLLTLNQKMAEDGYIEKDRIVTIDALAAGNTAKAQASIQDAFQRRDPAVAAEYQEKADKQDVARSNAASELTRQGLLPDITIQGGKYVVTSDGKSATFGTWDQARDVATQHMTEMERHQADIVAHMANSLNLGENETVNVRQRAETMGERIAAGSITPANALNAAIASGIVKGVDASKAADIAHHIFGGGTLDEQSDLLRQTVENIIVLGSNDVAGGKSNSIVNLRAGQVVNPHPFRTVLEETVEGRWKSGLAAGKFTKAQGVAWVKLAEQATGHNFTEGMTHEEMLASAEASPRALTEAISRIVDAEILGRMTGGKHLAPGAVSASLDMTDKEQSALAAILAAFREFFKVALHAAAKLIQARKEGKLGAEYDALLDHLTGSNGQHVHEAGSLKEQAHLIDTSGYSEATPGPNGETFSLRPGVTTEQDAKTPTTIYRAGDVNEVGVKPFSSWSTDEETAKQYQDNPGFGGESLRVLRVDAGNVLDLTRGNAFKKLAAALDLEEDAAQGWNDNGWLYPWEESSKIKRALQDSEFDAVKYTDDFPSGATTIIFTKEPSQLSPESSRDEGGTFSLRPGDFAARMDAAMAPFAGTPEQRALMGKIALERVKRLGSEWVAKAAKIRKSKDITKERNMREALGYDQRITAYLDSLSPGQRLTLETEPDNLMDDPFISAMLANGKLMSRKTAIAADKADTMNGEWDGMPYLPPSFYTTSLTGGRMPNQMAEDLRQANIGDGHTDTMWEQLTPILTQHAKNAQAYGQAQAEYKAASKAARVDARAESAAWENKEKSGGPAKQREMLKGALRTLDALLSAFPADVRVKVGGYVKLAGLATDEAMLKEIERRIGKMGVELEKYLKKEATKQIAKVFEKARAKSRGGKKPVGKIGADAHGWFDLAEQAFGMDSKEAEDRIAEIQGRLDTDPTITPEDAASMQSEVAILQTFGGWENMGSEERTDALHAAEDAYKGGREAWQARVEARQAKDKERIETLLQSLGNRGRLSEKSDSSKKGKKNGASQALEFLFTFAQGLRQWFGKNPVTQEFSRQELGRQIAYRDTINTHEAEFAKIVDDEVKGKGGWWNKRRAREKFIFDNTRPVHTVKILEGRHVETEKMKAEDARSVVDDKNAAYTPEQRAQMQDQLDTIDAAKAAGVPAKRNVTFTTLKNAGEAKVIDLSQAEISWILALHAQEKLRPSLIKSGFDEASIKEMEAVEDPRMKNIRGWMVKKLKAEHAAISAIYSDLMGVSLPSIANYFPARFVHDGDVQGMALGGGSIPNGGMKSGPLKNRKTHTAQVALDFESHGTNLFTLFHGHAAEMGYWKQYAPLMRDIKAVLNNGQLKEAFKTAHGMSALKDMNAWVQALESGGLQDSHFNLAAAKLVQGFMGRYAATRLGFKLGTHMINMSSGLNALLDTSIPFKDVMASYGRTIAGFTGLVDKPKMTPLQAMRNDALQRRLQAGTTAEQRFAKDIREHGKPGIARDIMALGAHSLGVVDTMAGAWAAAASYDANFRIAKKSGLSDADAHIEATEGMERTVATTFQPVENSNKSLGELSGSLAWKLMTIFNTEVRQKVALEVSIVKRFLKGDATLGEAGRIVIVNHFVIGTFVWFMRAAAKDMMNGDDGDDDPAWEVSDWLASVITGPLSGIPFIGSALNYQIASTIGGKAYKSTDPFTGTTAEIQQGWRMLARHEDTGEILKGLVHLMNGSAILVGSDATVAASILGNAGLQIYQIGENLMDSLFD